MLQTRKGIQPLRRQIVRRLPTPADLRQRRPIVITERDRHVLLAVADFGYLTTDLIARAFFPEAEATRRSRPSAAHERLRLLWLWSFLDRLELPVARTRGGRLPFVYTLGARGVPLVEEDRGTDAGPVRRRRLDRFDGRFLDHDLVAAAFWASLVDLLRTGSVILDRWVAERTVRSWRERVPDPTSRRSLPVLPDGIAQIRQGDGTVQSLLLEVDCGTTSLARFRQKLRAFEAYRVSGAFARRFGHDAFDVVIVTRSWARLTNLWRLARQEVPAARWAAYRFGTEAVLAGDRFSEPVWIDLANHARTLLEPCAPRGSSNQVVVAAPDGGDAR